MNRNAQQSVTAGRTSEASCSPHAGEPNFLLENLVGGYEAILKQYARNLRKTQTPWECKLWAQLKSKKLAGYKFRRQQPIGSYIADFYNAEKRLIVELDGSQHADNMADAMRDTALNGLGYQVVRVWNNEIDRDLESVLSHILAALENTPHRNAPRSVSTPPQGGSRQPAAAFSTHTSPFMPV